jgi:DNA processing protein
MPTVEGETTLALTRRERLIWAALASDLRFGPKSFRLLLAQVPQLEQVWDEGDKMLMPGVPPEIVGRVFEIRCQTNLEQLQEKLERNSVQVLTLQDEAYPALLKEIAVPPAVLFVRGELVDQPTIAVVGTRSMTPYGKRVVGDIVTELARQGLVIVSGLALGIDGAAHRAALEGKGKTWAVLASGVDQPYPASHRQLANDILASGGALISEFPLGTGALKHHFPIRNRIIAGLSRATLVIEAGEQSGTLLTARSALESNRDVLTVPGSIYSPHSRGPHSLLQLGAKLVQSAEDILFELHLTNTKNEQVVKTIVPDSNEEALILSNLGAEPISMDDLVVAVGLDAATVMSTVTLMEMKGRLRNLGNNCFVRR